MATSTCTTQALNIVVTGKPGCGKGTQSTRLVDAYGLKHISTGELLREVAEKNTQEGKEIKKLLETGGLLSDDLIMKVLKNNMPECNFILDGFPRKLSQTCHVNNVNLVIYFDITDDESVERILSRNQNRPDDNEEAIGIRLNEYKQRTEPILEFYQQKGLLVKVDGMRAPDDVFAEVAEIIYKKFGISKNK